MADQMDKLSAFIQSILNDAKAECDSIFAEMEKERSKSLSTAEDEILAETYSFIKTEVSRIKTQAGQAISKKVLENKRILFAKRGEVALRVLEEVKKRLAVFTGSEEYLKYLTSLLLNVLKQFEDSETVIYLRPADMNLAESLKKAAGRGNIRFSQTDDIKYGGLIAECPSKLLRADESFDTSLIDVQGHFYELLGLGIASQQSPTSNL